jgi:hypothetical protein|tara:strand:- start:14 stop:193 length:180 start_codon:yes stop_codon:yes gene_type:complete
MRDEEPEEITTEAETETGDSPAEEEGGEDLLSGLESLLTEEGEEQKIFMDGLRNTPRMG